LSNLEIPKSDVVLVEEIKQSILNLKNEIRKVIIGQDEIIDQLLLSLLAKGHCMLIGVPGLAKTLLIKTLSEVLDLRFNRIQFTPDLMPSDITGTEIIEEDSITKKRSFRFIKGPLFANIILADEINRTPPKTQAALLESMKDYKITAAGVSYKLEEPFFVLATQNPINVIKYAVTMVGKSRPQKHHSDKYIQDMVNWGAGPRASQFLILAAKSKAVMEGRFAPTIDDVRANAIPVLRHRIIPNFSAEADGVSSVDIIKKIFE